MNNRHVLGRMWAKGITRFMYAAPEGVECNTFAVISEDESVQLCRDFGFEFLRHPNKPLGKKFNAGLQYAIEKFEWDYLLLMGDDDFISSEAWNHYLPLMQGNYPYFGFSSIYFYSPTQKKARVFDYALQGCPNKLIGCGRMFSRTALEMVSCNVLVKFFTAYRAGGCNYHANTPTLLPYYQADYLWKLKVCEIISTPVFNFWKDEQEKGLDNESEVRLLMNGMIPLVMQSEKPMMTDVKTSLNLWGFDHFTSTGVPATVEEATAILSHDELNYLREHLMNDANEIVLQEEKFTVPDVLMVGDSAELFVQRKNAALLEKYFEKKTGRKLLKPEKVTAVRFKDHPRYFEYWENFKKPYQKFIAGFHVVQEKNEITFSIVENEKMSKVPA